VRRAGLLAANGPKRWHTRSRSGHVALNVGLQSRHDGQRNGHVVMQESISISIKLGSAVARAEGQEHEPLSASMTASGDWTPNAWSASKSKPVVPLLRGFRAL